jgi:hypothetical protein
VPGTLMDHTPLRRIRPICHPKTDADAVGVKLTDQANASAGADSGKQTPPGPGISLMDVVTRAV